MLNPVDSLVRSFLEYREVWIIQQGDLSGRCCYDSLGEKLINYRWWLSIRGRNGTRSGAPELGRIGGGWVAAVYFTEFSDVVRLAWRKKGVMKDVNICTNTVWSITFEFSSPKILLVHGSPAGTATSAKTPPPSNNLFTSVIY
jgi:hypothetical protein